MRTHLKFVKLIYPVLGLIGVVVVFILVTNLWSFLSDLKGSSLEESAEVYIATGKAEKQSYGEPDFADMLSGELLLEGDKVRSLKNSRTVLNFFDETIVRLDQNSMVSLEDVTIDDSGDIIKLKVMAGQVWVYKKKSAKAGSQVVVDTNYLTVNAVGTAFGVKSGLPESVNVTEGNVLISVHEFDSVDKNVVEEVNIATGQEFIMDSIAYDSFLKREIPAVVAAVSDKTKKSTWYKWNTVQDQNPFSMKPYSLVDATDSEDGSEADSNLVAVTSNGPKVTFPKNGEILNTDTVNITGTVPSEAQKVVVISYDAEPPTPYVLKGFKPGDATFKYIAKYDLENGNMKKGNNRYEIFYVDENGEESDKTVLEFVYSTDAADTPPTTESVKETETPATVEVLEYLSPAKLLTVNEQPFVNNFTLTESRGLIEGQIGTWAKSVVVNGYKLEQYTPYSGSFVYILSDGFGTLKPGENKITVSGFDKDGKKSVPVTFTVVKK
jgi:hypothetical protein